MLFGVDSTRRVTRNIEGRGLIHRKGHTLKSFSQGHKKGKGKSHIQSVRREVPVREDTCPEPLAF